MITLSKKELEFIVVCAIKDATLDSTVEFTTKEASEIAEYTLEKLSGFLLKKQQRTRAVEKYLSELEAEE